MIQIAPFEGCLLSNKDWSILKTQEPHHLRTQDAHTIHPSPPLYASLVYTFPLGQNGAQRELSRPTIYDSSTASALRNTTRASDCVGANIVE